VPSVARWKLVRFHPEHLGPAVAVSLGLDEDDLHRASLNVYSQSCLLLVLFIHIHQVHRHLKPSASFSRANLLGHSKKLLDAVGTASLGRDCCELLTKKKLALKEIIAGEDTRDVGKEISRLITQLGCGSDFPS
jgi:hypothetical protein